RNCVVAADAPRALSGAAPLPAMHDSPHADAGRPAHDALHLLSLPLRSRTLHAVRAVPARKELHPSARARRAGALARDRRDGALRELRRARAARSIGRLHVLRGAVMLLDPDAVSKALERL